MNRKDIFPGLIHIEFDTQEELCSTMVRMQEFYESPFQEIRGKLFLLERFKTLYAASRSHKNYSYNTDWCGFNIPGHIIRMFYKLFSDHCELNDKEKAFLSLLPKELSTDGRIDHFYVIATHKQDTNTSETIEHEIAHALYYLNSDYNELMRESIQELGSELVDIFTEQLKEMGYDDSTIPDEIQAHLATDTEPYLLSAGVKNRDWFRFVFNVFNSTSRTTKMTNPEFHTCPTCGYQWKHGEKGTHSCSSRLAKQYDVLLPAFLELVDALRDHTYLTRPIERSSMAIETAEKAMITLRELSCRQLENPCQMIGLTGKS